MIQESEYLETLLVAVPQYVSLFLLPEPDHLAGIKLRIGTPNMSDSRRWLSLVHPRNVAVVPISCTNHRKGKYLLMMNMPCSASWYSVECAMNLFRNAEKISTSKLS